LNLRKLLHVAFDRLAASHPHCIRVYSLQVVYPLLLRTPFDLINEQA
jgi:hypothetical protein